MTYNADYSPEQKQASQVRFLAALRRTGNVSHSAEEAGINRSTQQRWRDDPAYLTLFEEAMDVANDALEGEARRRAVDGIDEPVFYKGDVVGYVKRYSDHLLALLLKANKPDKYRERTDVNFTGTLDIAEALGAARKRAGGAD